MEGEQELIDDQIIQIKNIHIKNPVYEVQQRQKYVPSCENKHDFSEKIGNNSLKGIQLKIRKKNVERTLERSRRLKSTNIEVENQTQDLNRRIFMSRKIVSDLGIVHKNLEKIKQENEISNKLVEEQERQKEQKLHQLQAQDNKTNAIFGNSLQSPNAIDQQNSLDQAQLSKSIYQQSMLIENQAKKAAFLNQQKNAKKNNLSVNDKKQKSLDNKAQLFGGQEQKNGKKQQETDQIQEKMFDSFKRIFGVQHQNRQALSRIIKELQEQSMNIAKMRFQQEQKEKIQLSNRPQSSKSQKSSKSGATNVSSNKSSNYFEKTLKSSIKKQEQFEQNKKQNEGQEDQTNENMIQLSNLMNFMVKSRQDFCQNVEKVDENKINQGNETNFMLQKKDDPYQILIDYIEYSNNFSSCKEMESQNILDFHSAALSFSNQELYSNDFLKCCRSLYSVPMISQKGKKRSQYALQNSRNKKKEIKQQCEILAERSTFYNQQIEQYKQKSRQKKRNQQQQQQLTIQKEEDFEDYHENDDVQDSNDKNQRFQIQLNPVQGQQTIKSSFKNTHTTLKHSSTQNFNQLQLSQQQLQAQLQQQQQNQMNQQLSQTQKQKFSQSVDNNEEGNSNQILVQHKQSKTQSSFQKLPNLQPRFQSEMSDKKIDSNENQQKSKEKTSLKLTISRSKSEIQFIPVETNNQMKLNDTEQEEDEAGAKSNNIKISIYQTPSTKNQEEKISKTELKQMIASYKASNLKPKQQQNQNSIRNASENSRNQSKNQSLNQTKTKNFNVQAEKVDKIKIYIEENKKIQQICQQENKNIFSIKDTCIKKQKRLDFGWQRFNEKLNSII